MSRHLTQGIDPERRSGHAIDTVHATHWRLRRLHSLGVILLFIVCAAVVGGIAYGFGLKAAASSLRDDAEHKLESYSSALGSELSRYDYLPAVLALDGAITQVVRHPEDSVSVSKANAFLEAANGNADTTAIYVMDLNGNTLAASNWRSPVSFVGMRFDFRPYFKEAKAGGAGRFYGIGVANRESGLYFSRPVLDAGRIIGAVATKVDVDKVTLPWQGGRDPVLVADENGIIFLASNPTWKFETLSPLTPETIARLAETRQYLAGASFAPIDFRPIGSAAGAELIEWQSSPGRRSSIFPATQYMLRERLVQGTGWRILSLSDMRPAQEFARRTALAASALTGLFELLMLFMYQRKRALGQRLAAREALEQAYEELERQVDVRTRDLSASNLALHQQINERKRTQRELTETFEELAHAGKLAALGQMAAGIAHELNQPLAALHTLSDNAIVFLSRSQHDIVRENLEAIVRLVRRMADMTGELKIFARKAPSSVGPVQVSVTLSNAVSLLRQRFATDRIRFTAHFPASAPMVLSDEGRLQQVFVNLLSNAADALHGQENKQIDAFFETADGAVGNRARYAIVRIADNGAGLSEEVFPRLFEPFFTTKPQGVGLGLGLAIVQGILRGFGGSIEARNRDTGGAEFLVRLPLADQDQESAT